ncbi:MAG: hypothetical protein LUC34_02545 [Campylobacter sp.]|nr:hypothetical protein [Campylobacter sp.]
MKVLKSFTIEDRVYNKSKDCNIPTYIAMEYTAAGLSRLWQWRSQTAIGTISANRKYKDSYYTSDTINNPKDFELTKQENKERTKELEADLRKNKSIGYLKIQGYFPEKDKTGEKVFNLEDSFFVYSLNPSLDLKSYLIKLGVRYSQDSIAYSEAGSDTVTFYVTNNFGNNTIGSIDGVIKGTRWDTLEYITKDKEGQLIKELTDYYSKFKGHPFWFGFKDIENPEDQDEYYKEQRKNTINIHSIEDVTANEIMDRLYANRRVISSSLNKGLVYLDTKFALSDILKDNYKED